MLPPTLPIEVWQSIAGWDFRVACRLRCVVRIDLRLAAVTALQRFWRARGAPLPLWESTLGGVHGTTPDFSLFQDAGWLNAELSQDRRSVQLRGRCAGYVYSAVHAVTKMRPPPSDSHPVTFLLALVIRGHPYDRSQNDALYEDAVKFRVAAFDPSDTDLPLLTTHEDEENEEGFLEIDVDVDVDFDVDGASELPLVRPRVASGAEFVLDRPPRPSTQLTTQHPAFNPKRDVAAKKNMLRTWLRIDVVQTAERGRVVQFALEDTVIRESVLPGAREKDWYRLIVSSSYNFYARLVSPARLAEMFA